MNSTVRVLRDRPRPSSRLWTSRELPVLSSYGLAFSVPSISPVMSSRLRFNSAAFVVLTGLFVFATLNLSRLRVPSFSLDPCDAVMHFAVFTILLGVIGSLRALLPYRGVAHPMQEAYVLRSQQVVALAAFSAFIAYAVVLARHPSMWVNAEWRNQSRVVRSFRCCSRRNGVVGPRCSTNSNRS
jgi:hypothetical protein